jgi:hypothetical protein
LFFFVKCNQVYFDVFEPSSNKEGRGFKGIRLRVPKDKIQEEGQTQLISNAVTAVNTGISNCQKNLSSASGEICVEQKPALSALVALSDKKCIDDEAEESKVTALIQHEPIHYHILPPNEPHPCDKYGCPREAKYKLEE